MPDPSTGNEARSDSGLGATSQSLEDHPPKSTSASNAPYATTTAKRGVRSTRTPAGTKNFEPHRSQTVPLPKMSLESQPHRGVRPPMSTPTMPLPDTRPRKSSGGPSYNPLGPNSDYIVEPLPSSSFHSQDQHDRESPYLAPPSAMPVPITDARQSTSSFQTEPSSYYSLEDNWSSVGGPQVSMPDHDLRTMETKPSQDDSEAPALPNPYMPTPEMTPPPMPSPHFGAHPSTVLNEESEWTPGEYGTVRMPGPPTIGPRPQVQPQTRPPRPPRARYEPPWPAGSTPPIPPAPTIPPPMPSPNAGQTRPGVKFTQTQPDTQHLDSYDSQPSAGLVKPGEGGTVPSTAPLRVHHHTRPAGAAPTAASTPFTSAPSNTGRVSNAQVQPSASRIESQTTSTGGSFKAGAGHHSSTAGSTGRHDTHPSVASTITPSATSHKPSAPTNPQAKPTSVYSQQASPHRVESNQPTFTKPAATSAEHHPSPVPLKGHQETHPNAHISTVTPSTASQRASTVHTQSSSGRPQGAAAPIRSERPPITAPQASHHASTSSSEEKVKQQHRAQSSAAAAAAVGASIPTRPQLHRGTPSQLDTQYVHMLLALDDIPKMHNIFAGFFNWILLAGFILFPGTFTSLQNLSAASGGQVPAELVDAVTHIPLYVIAWVCCAVGALGMIWLWWRWRKNYIYALENIFLPGLMNSLMGLLSTVVNVLGVQHGELVTTSKSTVIVTTASTGIFAILTGFYALWLVRRVKAKHDREVGQERAGKHGEGVVDLSKRRIRG